MCGEIVCGEGSGCVGTEHLVGLCWKQWSLGRSPGCDQTYDGRKAEGLVAPLLEYQGGSEQL